VESKIAFSLLLSQLSFVTKVFEVIIRVTTCLENLEMSGNLTAVREMSGILLKVGEMSGKQSCQGKFPCVVTPCLENLEMSGI